MLRKIFHVLFATEGANLKVDPRVENCIKSFHKKNKPIGVCCISPVVVAKVLGKKNNGPGVRLTLGKSGENWPYKDSIEAARSLGNQVEEKNISEVEYDAKSLIYSTPAYMKGDATPYEVFSGIENMISWIVVDLNKI